MAGKNVHRQLVTLNSGVKYKQFTHVIIRDLCFLLKKGCFIKSYPFKKYYKDFIDLNDFIFLIDH